MCGPEVFGSAITNFLLSHLPLQSYNSNGLVWNESLLVISESRVFFYYNLLCLGKATTRACSDAWFLEGSCFASRLCSAVDMDNTIPHLQLVCASIHVLCESYLWCAILLRVSVVQIHFLKSHNYSTHMLAIWIWWIIQTLQDHLYSHSYVLQPQHLDDSWLFVLSFLICDKFTDIFTASCV